MKYFILSLCIFSLSTTQAQQLNFLHGTSILTIISPDTIWMAADSKLNSSLDPNGKYSVDKIFETKNIFYAFAEVAYLVDKKNDTLFDAAKILRNIINKKTELKYTINPFNDSIVNKLNVIINSSKYRKDTFKQKYLNKQVLQAVMATFVKGKPMCFSITYMLREDNSGSLFIVPENPLVYEEGMEIFFLGHHDEIKKFIARNPDYLINGHLREKIVCLVKIEADSNKDVDLPITEVIFNPNQKKWRTGLTTCDF
jgi:hypothetical protein